MNPNDYQNDLSKIDGTERPILDPDKEPLIPREQLGDSNMPVITEGFGIPDAARQDVSSGEALSDMDPPTPPSSDS